MNAAEENPSELAVPAPIPAGASVEEVSGPAHDAPRPRLHGTANACPVMPGHDKACAASKECAFSE